MQHSLTLARRQLAGVAIDSDELNRLFDQAVAGFVALDDDFGLGMTRVIQAVAALGAGNLQAASVAVEAARRHGTHSGDRFARGRASWIEGLIAQARGDSDAAYRLVERGLRLLDDLGMGREVTAQAGVLITLAQAAGEHDLAAQWRAFVGDGGGGLARHDLLVMASARNGEGLRARRSGEFALARAAHLEALSRYRDAGVPGGVAYTESCLGFLADQMGQREVAAGHHAAALSEAREADEPGSVALAVEGMTSGFPDERAEWAAVMLGAAKALWDLSAARDPASHRDDVGAIGERARLVLGAEGFAAAFAHGTRLGREQILAMARSGELS
jgi:hypothetical protein